jgi:hypothetical protein
MANYYVTSSAGELVRTVRAVGYPGDGEKDVHFVMDQNVALRGLFEAQKKYWLTKYGTPPR